ncbi:M3 family oligoendopeptidase [Ornithinibacillus sp. L9]|uniref:M3 family oligoendopeptidase n=1 Tax=Ornithinibacillus caprae TaxID=2678566 RepID=A0A6N8FMF8_9BACI|nr:M3 family oligoendopeptidase [Ornithinibacillus caprae]MUK90523.1 M3 family oligoendopeptidase [Ornithinibacillus caprae]
MVELTYQEKWSLESIFHGGSHSPQFRNHINKLDKLTAAFEEVTKELSIPIEMDDVATMITNIIDHHIHIRTNLSQAKSFLTCLIAQNSNDQHAITLQEKVNTIRARYENSLQKAQQSLADIDEHLWEKLQESSLKKYTFILDQWRKKARYQLPLKNENIISDLQVDGYHAWGSFYKTYIGKIKVPILIDHGVKKLSIGQAINLRSHPDEQIRKQSHDALEDTWSKHEDILAKILNHIAGFRIEVYKKRGIENTLDEALLNNQMQRETLNAMWKAVDHYKKPFVEYLNQKAKQFDTEKMQAHNFWAPMKQTKQRMSYQDGVDFILEHFSQFGSQLENFSRHAFHQGWVEAKDRPNKQAGGFCASFPLSKESRIFMTYGGRITDILTLAHELGHAFHNYAMNSISAINKQYPLNMAETASTFSEMIVLDAAMKKAESFEEELFLLDEKLKRSVMNFMNIHSRFLFETRFLEEKKSGYVPAKRLNELMNESINEAYKGSIINQSIHSWAWVPHFYLTTFPFYNFPYTFGYLFSMSLYAKAKDTGKEFEKNYLQLLRDSGSMPVEALVKKHLHEDITKEDFWEKGLKICTDDAMRFVTLLRTKENDQKSN